MVLQKTQNTLSYDKDGKIISQDKTVITESVAKCLGIGKGDTITIKNTSDLKSYNLRGWQETTCSLQQKVKQHTEDMLKF